ncbi:DEAD/DEAH box helicase [Pedobacter sp. GR22-6]|uniref:DEAD/DEAH box helicase n=1 Tax=Pedobacter sp. GR22-6 TaxID=3127957 RepID=UPI00307E31A7
MLFEELSLIEPILKALQTEGYTQPTPIQEQSIPSILQGRDLLGCAQTGTGKTAAFAIPMLQLLSKPHANTKVHKAIKALVLTPTRELAIQIEESFKAYGKNLPIRHLVIFGGVGQKSQTDALHRGVDILVATPGRLLDLMNQGFISLKDIELFVLDEADRMLDMGFIHDVKKVIAKLPAIRQTLFFSATMPKEIQTLADTILRNPVKVEVTPVSSTAEKIQQQIFYVEKQDKRGLLMHILQDKTIETALVFARTKHGADKIVKDLIKSGIRAEAIHGNKSQNARQRALTNFKAKTTRILVATDIAARGIDVDELAHVINYELPNVPETYVHRIGRTGRAGLSGTAFSFCDAEEKEFLDDIEKLIGLKLPVQEDHPFAMSWQSLMSGAAAAKSKGKAKPSRGARPERTSRPSGDERQPNLSGAKRTPKSGSRRWGKPKSTNS